jgi:hypothetical protein
MFMHPDNPYYTMELVLLDHALAGQTWIWFFFAWLFLIGLLNSWVNDK